MTCYLVTGDLLFSSRFMATAESIGSEAVVVSNAAQLRSSAATRPARRVFVDLTSPGSDLTELLEVVGEMDSRPAVVAYGPHVMEAKLEEARQAGCDEVLSKGQFNSQMEARLQA